MVVFINWISDPMEKNIKYLRDYKITAMDVDIL
jgi:hypothetical protein